MSRKGSSDYPYNFQNLFEGYSVGLSERYRRVSSPPKLTIILSKKEIQPLPNRSGKWIKKRGPWQVHGRSTSIAWYGFSDQSLEGVERHTPRRGADLFRNRPPDRTPQIGARRSKCMCKKPIHSRGALPSSGTNRRRVGRLQRPLVSMFVL